MDEWSTDLLTGVFKRTSPETRLAALFASKRLNSAASVAGGHMPNVAEVARHPDLARWTVDMGSPRGRAMVASASIGDLATLQWMMATCPAEEADGLDYAGMCRSATMSCSIPVMEWLFSLGRWVPNEEAAFSAVRLGNAEVVGWLSERGFVPSERAACAAVGAGQTRILEWMMANGHSRLLGGQLYSIAAARGDVGMLMWLSANVDCQQSARTAYLHAAMGLHVGAMAWMRGSGVLGSGTAASEAVARGKRVLEVARMASRTVGSHTDT